MSSLVLAATDCLVVNIDSSNTLIRNSRSNSSKISSPPLPPPKDNNQPRDPQQRYSLTPEQVGISVTAASTANTAANSFMLFPPSLSPAHPPPRPSQQGGASTTTVMNLIRTQPGRTPSGGIDGHVDIIAYKDNEADGNSLGPNAPRPPSVLAVSSNYHETNASTSHHSHPHAYQHAQKPPRHGQSLSSPNDQEPHIYPIEGFTANMMLPPPVPAKARRLSTSGQVDYAHITSPSATSRGGEPRVSPLPSMATLHASLATLDDEADSTRLHWSQDTIRVLDTLLCIRDFAFDFSQSPTRPAQRPIPPDLDELLQHAIPIIISFTTHKNTQLAAEATYLKAKLLATGCCPDFLPWDPRQAFRDFETAARSGAIRGWFQLGRDYELVGDATRARTCFERGRAKGDCECTYRMGMARLLGQLNLPSDPEAAVPLLHRSAELSTIDFPVPAYVYGMLLAGEIVSPADIPAHLILPPHSTPSDALSLQFAQARDSLERAAFLGHTLAQYKCGWLAEHAALGSPYDPLVSVQWYSFASQGGDVEADMALSKWFLCGAEPQFGKNEGLARTFAEKAAQKGHPNGCFAMGYYFELGIGGERNIEKASVWYKKAANLSNHDAISRLAALSQPQPTAISIEEHETRLAETLVRRRTQAKIRSDTVNGRRSVSQPRSNALEEMERVARGEAGSSPSSVAFPSYSAASSLPSRVSSLNISSPSTPDCTAPISPINMPIAAPTPRPTPLVPLLPLTPSSYRISVAPRPGEIMLARPYATTIPYVNTQSEDQGSGSQSSYPQPLAAPWYPQPLAPMPANNQPWYPIPPLRTSTLNLPDSSVASILPQAETFGSHRGSSRPTSMVLESQPQSAAFVAHDQRKSKVNGPRIVSNPSIGFAKSFERRRYTLVDGSVPSMNPPPARTSWIPPLHSPSPEDDDASAILPESDAPPNEIVLTTSSSALTQSIATHEKKGYDSPQTFAEMGFKSRPVEEEGCILM